jgi:hypothetical protein
MCRFPSRAKRAVLPLDGGGGFVSHDIGVLNFVMGRHAVLRDYVSAQGRPRRRYVWEWALSPHGISREPEQWIEVVRRTLCEAQEP